MINRLESLLKENKGVSAYLINFVKANTTELFYVLDKLETNRATDYSECYVTVYHDFEQYRGSANIKISVNASDIEIKEKIEEAVFAASFVKNAYHDIPKKEEYTNNLSSNLSEKPLNQYADKIVEAIFKADSYENGWINSTEIFLYHNNITIVNSNGVNVNFDKYRLMVEVIPTWKSEKEEFELYKSFEVSNIDYDNITKEVNEILTLAKSRSEAVTIPQNLNCKIILVDDEVKQIFRAFVTDLSYTSSFLKVNLSELGKSVQGDDITGDKMDITLTPFIKGSVNSSIVDDDGVVLKDVKIIDNAIAVNNHGSYRFGYYLNVKNPTGIISNIVAKVGNKSFEDMKQEPYIYCASFSGMQLDFHSGFFGGEVRLAFYFDGKKCIPVTGFSISGNIHEAKKNLVFSSEEVTLNGYKGPKYIEIKGMQIL